MNGVILDTHVWLWALDGAPQLTPQIHALIESDEILWLSPISIWEVGLLVRRRRMEVDTDLRSWLDDSHDTLPVREAALTREVALTADEIALETRDPADRFLAATALVYDLTLATVDKELLDADWLPTVG